MKQKLANIYTTLNQVELKGDANVEYMYGVFITLRELIQELDNQEKEIKEDKTNKNKDR